MKRQQCLYYQVLSTILITNCDKFFFFPPFARYFHTNKPKMQGERLQWADVFLWRLGAGGVMVPRLEQYFPAAEPGTGSAPSAADFT